MCIIMSAMKSIMEKSFRSFLFYSNLKYDKISWAIFDSRHTEPINIRILFASLF